MDSLRKWIVGLAAGSFAAGAMLGHAAAGTGAGNMPVSEQAYLEQMTADYGLAPKQQQSLALVLRHLADAETAILRNVQEDQLPPAVVSQLKHLRRQTEQRFRALLDDGQRERYDRDSRPEGRAAGTPSTPSDKR
jgi:hypothetical protein